MVVRVQGGLQDPGRAARGDTVPAPCHAQGDTACASTPGALGLFGQDHY